MVSGMGVGLITDERDPFEFCINNAIAWGQYDRRSILQAPELIYEALMSTYTIAEIQSQKIYEEKETKVELRLQKAATSSF